MLFHKKSSGAMGSDHFLAALKDRRSLYALEATSPIPNSRIREILTEIVKHVPSSFNAQSTRLVVLLAEQHKKLWEDIVKPAVKAVAPPEAWAASEQKLSGFANACGTVLFYEDPAPIHTLQTSFPLYSAQFPIWSQDTNAMHQYAVWVALEQEGLGASLQHYHPLIDDKVAATWDVPREWELKAQIVFGTPVGTAGEKTFRGVEGERLFIHGG